MSPPPLPSPAATTAEVGQGPFCYQTHVDWAQLPAGWSLVEVAGVATDSADNVFVFNRGQHPVIVFDREGRFLRSWGEGQFVRPHGITIGPDDAVYCVDDTDHTLRKYTPQGRLLWTLGTSGQPSDTGARSVDYRQIVRSAGPFNFPTNVALAADGSLFVADGYGNAQDSSLYRRVPVDPFVGRAGGRAGSVPRAARDRGRPRRHGVGGRSREQPAAVVLSRGKVSRPMDRHGAPQPGGVRRGGKPAGAASGLSRRDVPRQQTA